MGVYKFTSNFVIFVAKTNEYSENIVSLQSQVSRLLSSATLLQLLLCLYTLEVSKHNRKCIKTRLPRAQHVIKFYT